MEMCTPLDHLRESNSKSFAFVAVFHWFAILIFNRRGQLGLGTLDAEEEPVLVDALAGIKVSLKYSKQPVFRMK